MMGIRSILGGLVHKGWHRQDDEMNPTPQPQIDPAHRDRIERAIRSADVSVAAGKKVRKQTEQVTEQLVRVRQVATGIMGADLLANREGRVPGGTEQ